MWRKATLSLPGSLVPVSCAILPVHPWVYGAGHREGTGHYLSPQNAVDYLAGRLAAGGGQQQILVFMVCATDSPAFIQALTRFSTVLPLPVFSQVARMAGTAATLPVTRMQRPAAAAAGLPRTQPLSAATRRRAINARRTAQAATEAAAAASPGGLQSALSDFTAARAAALAGADRALTGLLAASTPAWVFTGSGSAATLAGGMKKNVPQQDAVFTLATLFAGKELTPLEAMINDTNRHAGAGR